MDVHARLVRIVAESTSPKEALSSAARAVAQELQAEACSIFIRWRTGDGLELRAHFGEPLTADTTVAEKASLQVLPVTDDAGMLVAVPVASINRAIGAIVARRTTGSPFTTEEIMRLSGVASQLVQLVASVGLIEAIEGEAAEAPTPTVSAGERVLRGFAASPGIAIGVAVFRNTSQRGVLRRETAYRGPAVEAASARDAYEKTRNDLLKLQSAAATEIGEEQALIFGAHLMLLNDPMVIGLVDAGIASGRPAALAVDDAFDEMAHRLLDLSDPYLQERIEDIEDLRLRILGHLVGAERPHELDTRIVVSSRTTPSLLIELKARGAVGIVSELGGVTSHGVLLARALGIPAVTGVSGLTRNISANDVMIVDGSDGTVIVQPTQETRATYAERGRDAQRKRTEFRRYRELPARTADGVRFDLHANIALGADLDVARENRADGIGLYRTEFPFIVRDALPTVGEQVRIYAKAYDVFPVEPITFRLLDLAGDKFLPSTGLGVSRSAFHGYRSIRILFDYPHILRDQVQALAIAAGDRPLRILIPMVTAVDDVVRVKRLAAVVLAQTAHVLSDADVVWGAMIETAAAVELVTDLAREVQFFSIGTNDLIQYTLVVDREDPRLASPRHSYHPAILRMIRRVAKEAHEAGRPVSVCGEMAAQPELALALLAMEIDSLSVSPREIPRLKRAFAVMPLEPLRGRIDEILALATEDDVIAALRELPRRASSHGVASAVDEEERSRAGAQARPCQRRRWSDS